MRLFVGLNGAQLAADHLLQVIAVSGANTVVRVNTAQALPIDTLLTAISAAGSKRFIADFNGAQLAGDNLRLAIDAAGVNTAISMNTAQATPLTILVSALQVAAGKEFSVDFNGDQLSGYNLQQIVEVAGANTSISVNTAHATPIPSLIASIQMAGSRVFEAEFNGVQLSGNQLGQAISAAGANTTIGVNTAQAMPIDVLLAALHSTGTKRFRADFNGAQLVGNNLALAIAAAGVNSSISLNTAQAVPIATLLATIQATGEKQFGVEFNGDQLSGNNLQQAIEVAGVNTLISIGTAHATPVATLAAAMNAAGSKRINAAFNGVQVTGDQLQRVVSAASTNASISVNAAQALPLSMLLDVIAIAG